MVKVLLPQGSPATETETIDPEPWMDQSECNIDNAHLFASTVPEEISQAKSLCAVCPVALECLDYALRIEKGYKTRFNIFGGLTGKERRKLAKLLEGN